jgi:hypothetical protein
MFFTNTTTISTIPKSIEFVGTILRSEAYIKPGRNTLTVPLDIIKKLFIDEESIIYKFTSNSDIASANNIIEILKLKIKEFKENNNNYEYISNLQFVHFRDIYDEYDDEEFNKIKKLAYEKRLNKHLIKFGKMKDYYLSIISKLKDVIANLNRLLKLELTEEDPNANANANRLNTRINILMLSEGTKYSNDEHSSNHISQYLLNELVIKELCSYNMEFTDPIFEWGYDEYTTNFVMLFPGDKAHKYFLENEV